MIARKRKSAERLAATRALKKPSKGLNQSGRKVLFVE